MIIFGLKGTIKDRGEAVPAVCPRCHNVAFFHYVSRTRWFSLFFIPVVPIASKHFVTCPVCKLSVPLDTEGRDQAGRMVELTGRWRAGALSVDAYRNSVESYVQGQLRGSFQALALARGGPSADAPPRVPPPPGNP